MLKFTMYFIDKSNPQNMIRMKVYKYKNKLIDIIHTLSFLPNFDEYVKKTFSFICFVSDCYFKSYLPYILQVLVL